jgi:hypothetical protein
MSPDQSKAFAEHVMPLFLDSAKNYSQLAAGAIALSVAFKEKVLGEKAGARVSGLLASAWLVLLISIGAGALYNYFGIGIVDHYVTGREISFHSDITYGVMLVTFFAGATLLVLALTQQLVARARP